MGELKASFWHKLVEAWITYLLIGICLIPFGAAYALITIYRPFGSFSDSVTVLAVCLGFGLLFAHLMRRNLTRQPSVPTVLVSQQLISENFTRLTIGESIPISLGGAATVIYVMLAVGHPSSKIVGPFPPNCSATNFVPYRIGY